jgi:CheY-like chemotaxis protein
MERSHRANVPDFGQSRLITRRWKDLMENPLASAPVELLDACLVVEDDSIIRLDIEETLRGFGFRIVLGASTLDAAAELAGTADIRFAVLDYAVGQSNTVAVAEQLVARGIPTVFLSAYGVGLELPAPVAHLDVVSKPFSSAALAEALLRALKATSAAESESIPCICMTG